MGPLAMTAIFQDFQLHSLWIYTHTHARAHKHVHTPTHTPCGFTLIRLQVQGSCIDVVTAGRQHYHSKGNREMVLIQTEMTAVV